MPPAALFDLGQVDLNRVIVDIEGIRKINPQRYEFEQLTAIVHIDHEQHIAVGYKDVTPHEFWVRGHMPDYPLMPGVIICEAAAQLAGFYCRYSRILPEGDFLAFGGLEEVRFRGPVHPGDRLVLVAKALKMNRRQVLSATQAYVNKTMVFQGNIIGVPFTRGKES